MDDIFEQFHLKLEEEEEEEVVQEDGVDVDVDEDDDKKKKNNKNVVVVEEEQPRQQQQQQQQQQQPKVMMSKNEGNENENENSNKEEEKPRQGRKYATKYSLKPGGIRVDEMLYGLQMAHMSCTDDSEERLQGSGANTIEALKFILDNDNDESMMHKQPLTELLQKQFNLNLDCWIDESGWLRGKPVDTQGFIASNETTIVLSYRFSTSGLDWLTNLSLWSSEWEPDRDEIIGHAGWCSCFDGRFTRLFTNRGKPRVHTGFYNNFIYAIPYIRKHILNKILNENEEDAKPKKIYICGCSLGAAIATMSFCFLLEELESKLANPQFNGIERLICVTAGSPKCCDNMMHDQIMSKLNNLRQTDRVVNCRLVYNCDVVPHIPFGSGYLHLDKGIYITADGEVLVNPDMKPTSALSEFQYVVHNFRTNVKQAKTKVKQTRKRVKAKGKQMVQDGKQKMQHRLSTKKNANNTSKKEGNNGDDDVVAAAAAAGGGDDANDDNDVSGGGGTGSEEEEKKKNDSNNENNNNNNNEKQDYDEETGAEQKKNQLEGEQQQQGLDTDVGTSGAAMESTITMEPPEAEITEKTEFEIECENTPQPIKDHMPYWYLTYLKQLKDKVDNGEV